MNTHLIYIILLVLTAAAGWAVNAQQGVVVVLGLGCMKLLLVAFCFMELRTAHPLWKCLVVAVPVLLLLVSSVVLR